ncbi:hypothetical protein V1511DRAFT_444968, partial [Dipodascopsis uninucleata]
EKDDVAVKEWLNIRIIQLYSVDAFMDLVRFTPEEVAAFEQSEVNMADMPEVYTVLNVKPSEIYHLVRHQLLQSASWPDSSNRKLQIWHELLSESNAALHMMYQKNGFLDDVALVTLWEHLAAVKAQNRRLRDILFGAPPSILSPEVVAAAPVLHQHHQRQQQQDQQQHIPQTHQLKHQAELV